MTMNFIVTNQGIVLNIVSCRDVVLTSPSGRHRNDSELVLRSHGGRYGLRCMLSDLEGGDFAAAVGFDDARRSH